MTDNASIERARLLAKELVRVCDALGNPLAGDFVIGALDELEGRASAEIVRENRAPWPSE